MSRALAACCFVALAAAPAAARAQAPEPVRLTLHPAAPVSPALRYRLLPELIEQKPGNAAEHYKKAVPLLKITADDSKQLEEWEKLPLDRLPCEEARRLLAGYKEALDLIDRGARCEYCDWGLTERLRLSGVAALLPELQPMRESARLLAMRARVEIAEGKFDQAVRTLRTGLALARHVGESATLISCLVGNAIANVMANEIDRFVQQPGAPNLYWPLTDLPRPLLDLRPALEGERVMAYGTFPGMADVLADRNAGPLSEEKVSQFSKTFFALEDNKPLRLKVTLTLRMQRRHEAAKRALVAAGRPRELVEKMPHVQVAVMDSMLQYDRLYEEALKWQTFPYAESLPHLRQREEREKAEMKATEGVPVLNLAGLLLPAIRKVYAARARIDRKYATLRCVEAVRLYAAAHGGKLPPTLGDVKEVPVPDNPMTGKPFEYKITGDGKATLSGPPAAGDERNAGGPLVYELTIQR
jgi:hypothetical protein